MGTAGNTDFAAVSAVCSLLSRLTVPYWIAGGWAVDLAVGRVTRDHADVDVMLLERDKRALSDDLPPPRYISRQAADSRHNPPSGRYPLPRPRGGTAVQGALESGQGPA